MPYIRCRHYTDGGDPLQGGCRRKSSGQCMFVHPDDPRWRSAPPSAGGGRGRTVDVGSFRGGGGDRTRGRGRGGGMAIEGGGSAGVSSGWDTGGDTGGWDKGGSSWGGGDGGWDTGGWDQGGSSGWGGGEGGREPVEENASTTNKKPTISNTIADLADAWEQATSTGWGAIGDVGNGWGSGGGAGWATNSSSWPTTGWDNLTNSGSGTETKEPNPSKVKDDKVASERKGKEPEDKVLPVPPRPSRPDIKMTGTNNVPLTNNKWGRGATPSKPPPRIDTSIPPPRTAASQLQSSQLPGTGTPSTPVITPAESSRFKRKHHSVFDENIDQFKDFIKAWERAVRAQYLLVEAEAELERWYKTQKSAVYSRIGEAGRKKLDAHRANLDKEVLTNRDKRSSAIAALIDFHESISCSIDLSRRYDIIDEANEYLNEARAFIDHLRTLAADSAYPLPLRAQEYHSPHQDHSAPRNSGDFISLRQSILDLEERLEEAQTELTLRHPRDIATEVDEKLDAKLGAVHAARRSKKDHVNRVSKSRIVIPPHLLEKMEETANHVQKIDAQTKQRVEKLELDTASTRELVARIHERLVTTMEQKSAQDEELKRLRGQFEQLATSGLVPPSVPNCDSNEAIMQRLQPALGSMMEKFYETEVRPTLHSISSAVLNSANQNHQETLAVMWEKMQPAMNVVDGMSRWLDSQELAMTAPRD
ncbi:hypothetical protein F5I97DRAFT_1846280 [Phlebopus sp. FC_14]|nr:hypothetical protein F5I97DRAFT_1846280 [Phlebopus sp. FC_14]